MNTATSRRTFLKTAAVGSAALGAGLATACSQRDEAEGALATDDLARAERIMGL